MHAIVYHRYGGPEILEYRKINRPAIDANEVLVRVRAASLNPYDWHFMRGRPLFMRAIAGLVRPKQSVLGADFAGTVEAAGEAVTRFQPGDEVFGLGKGAFAEYLSVPEDKLAPKPATVSFEAAAAVPIAGLTALQALRDKGEIRAGQQVLINGASGGVGTFAVQIAKSLGAEVTGVCSTRNLEMVLTLGAEHVVDYSREDFTDGDRRYDLVLDAVGNRSLSDVKRILKPEGRYVAVAGSPLRSLWMAVAGGTRLISMIAKANREDLETLGALIESGEMTPVVDRRVPLSGVPEAIGYLEEGHAQGKIIVTIEQEQPGG